MKFIKNNSYNIIRLMLNQFGMTIFGLVLSLSIAGIENSTARKLLLFVSIFATGFYLFLIYTMMWEQGARDIIRVESGRMAYDKYYGTKVALIANIINLVLAFLILVGNIIGTDSSMAFSDALYVFSNLFVQVTYLGIVSSIQDALKNLGMDMVVFRSVIYFITVLPAILTSTFAYILGCKNIRILPYKKKS